MDSLLDQLSVDFGRSAFWTVLGALVGIAATVSFDAVRDRLRRSRQKRVLRRNTAVLNGFSAHLNTITLGVGEPYSRIALEDSGSRFFIGFPEHRLQELAQSNSHPLCEWFEDHRDHYFDSNDLRAMEEDTGIGDLMTLVETQRQAVADDFVHRRNGCYFNHGKFGVQRLDTFTRTGAHETPQLSVELYKTDYFTHKVMRGVYRELLARGTPISDGSIMELAKFRGLTTSLGVNAVVLLRNGSEGDSFVFARRSTAATETHGRERMHVAVNEGLSLSDYDDYAHRLSLMLCLERGLREELNLTKDDFGQRVSAGFYDVFLTKDLFEIGITALVEIRDMSFKEVSSRADRARDRHLEVAGLEQVRRDEEDIRTFLENHAMVPHGLYTFARVAARLGLELEPDWVRLSPDSRRN